jgi:hypothetical protein
MKKLSGMNGKPFKCFTLIDYLKNSPVPRENEPFGNHTGLAEAFRMLHRSVLSSHGYYEDIFKKHSVRFRVIDRQNRELAKYSDENQNIVVTMLGRKMLLDEGLTPADFKFVTVADSEPSVKSEREEMTDVIEELLAFVETYDEELGGAFTASIAKAKEVLAKYGVEGSPASGPER